MGSIWSETVTLPSRSALEGEHSTEVAVVGGGMAGVLTAWFLRQRGAKVLLLEAERLAGGQTRNTTAKITAQHGMIYERLSEQKGELAARQYASANQRAVEAYRRLVRERKIPCEWEDCPAFLYSTQEEDPVRQEAHDGQRGGGLSCACLANQPKGLLCVHIQADAGYCMDRFFVCLVYYFQIFDFQ